MPKSPLCKLPNIGPSIANNIMMLGITTPEEFLEQDPYEIFYKLQTKVDPTLCRCVLSSIVGAYKNEKRHLVRKEAIQTYQKKYPHQERKTNWKRC